MDLHNFVAILEGWNLSISKELNIDNFGRGVFDLCVVYHNNII